MWEDTYDKPNPCPNYVCFCKSGCDLNDPIFNEFMKIICQLINLNSTQTIRY